MKTIIAGSRDFNDYDLLKAVCSKYNISTVISGTCRGADLLGERYAMENNIPIQRFPANWDLHGKSAGYIRNKEMCEHGERLIAFHKNNSKGTLNMIHFAEDKGLEVIIINVEGETKLLKDGKYFKIVSTEELESKRNKSYNYIL